MHGPNFTKLDQDIGRSSQHWIFVTEFGYLAAFSNTGGSNLSDVLNDAKFRIFDPLWKLGEGWAGSLYQLLKHYLQPNLQNTFDCRPLRGCWARWIDEKERRKESSYVRILAMILAMRILSVRPSLCLSDCPSVTRVNCDKTVERSVQIYIPYERTCSLVFWEEEWLVGATHSTWNFGSTGPRWSEFADFQPIFARSSSAVTPSEKSSINTSRKSTTRFPMSIRWSSYGASKSPKGSLQKRKTADFRVKLHFAWRKSATKFFLCENCQLQSCKAFIDLNVQKWLVGGDPLYLKFWIKVTALERNRRHPIYFRS